MTINAAMLVALGFLTAALLAVLIAPAYRRRIVRLTTDALKRTMPMTEAEIRADKDRLRAVHAIRIHNLEAKLESVTLSSARQKIEVNRRDARISELEGQLMRQKGQVDELENARRVLERTVMDRLPKIENRLGEAKKLLVQRDNEVSQLATTAQKQARALAEASQINIQQSSEIERLTTAISTRAARNQDTRSDGRFDGEVALRSEIEALRTKARDQAALITQLQDLVATAAAAPLAAAAAAAAPATDEFGRLQAELGEVHGALDMARAAAEEKSLAADAAGSELRALKSTNQDLTAEVARLTAALAAFEQTSVDRTGKESPIAMKAKIAALEASEREQATTIGSLRSELAALNERMARQAAHYMDEMKRLGAGSLPASGEARRSQADPRRSLADRITDRRVVRLTSLADKQDGEAAGNGSDVTPLFAVEEAEVRPSDDAVAAAMAAASTAHADSGAQPKRQRLLERITSIDKPGK